MTANNRPRLVTLITQSNSEEMMTIMIMMMTMMMTTLNVRMRMMRSMHTMIIKPGWWRRRQWDCDNDG